MGPPYIYMHTCTYIPVPAPYWSKHILSGTPSGPGWGQALGFCLGLCCWEHEGDSGQLLWPVMPLSSGGEVVDSLRALRPLPVSMGSAEHHASSLL